MIAHTSTVYDASNAAELKRAEIVAAAILELIFYTEKETVKQNIALSDIRRAVRRLYDAVMDDVDGALCSILSDDTIGDYTIKHSLNVCIFSMLTAKGLGCDMGTIIDIGTAALLHDVGKRFIGRDIIYKESFLTRKELEIVRSHTILGAAHIKSIYPDIPERMTLGILYHHERLNGDGYPRRLHTNIPYIAKIIATSDVFEAYMAKRPYHEKRSLSEGIDFILRQDGMDSEIVKCLVRQFYL